MKRQRNYLARMKRDHLRGFTLIELLVVIAIIALLLAIVLPGLRFAKEKAKDLICRTHVKGIGTAILLYLNDYKSRAFDNRESNGHLWHDAEGNFITPSNTSWWEDAYWGLGYRDYATDERFFSCPSFVLKNFSDLLYADDIHYNTTKTDLSHTSGYGLNSYFFRDPDAATTDVNRNHRNLSVLRSPSRFIVMHDHVEPKMEGDSSSGTEQNDMFYIPSGGSYNLLHYRTGDRKDYYKYIFRHCKKNTSRDEPSQLTARIPLISKSPNGNVNVLFLDGTVDKIPETIGQNILHNMYKGVGK